MKRRCSDARPSTLVDTHRLSAATWRRRLRSRQGGSLLLPAAASLALFVWLLTLHPHAAGRVYAAYGGIYVSVAILWLWAVDSVRPTATDIAGVAICILGMLVIMIGARHA